MNPDNNRALWRHVYFCERLLVCIALRLFGSAAELKRAFSSVSRDGDERLIDELFK